MKKVKLENIEPKHPFQAPEGYFEKLNQDILSRKEAANPEPVGIRLWKPALAFASIVVLVLVVINPFSSTMSAEDYLSEVSTEDIKSYLAYDLDETEILNYIDNSATLNFEDQPIDWVPELGDEELDQLYNELDIDELESLDI